MPQLLHSEKGTENEIVNIHFGLTDFTKIKTLVQIYDMMKEILRHEKRIQLYGN